MGWSWRQRWWFAAKPMSWPKLLVPMLVGQSMGASDAGLWSPLASAGGVALTVGLLCFIVFLNDAGDETVGLSYAELNEHVSDEMSGEAPMASALPTKGLQEAAAAAQAWAASRPRTAEEREAAEAARMRNEYGST